MMEKEKLRELRDATIGMNEDGEFLFKKVKNGKTKTYGPYSFGEMVTICWHVMEDFKKDKKLM